MTDTVKVWEEQVIIPTYKTGRPEKHPLFLERRVYQGSSGVVYPHPVIEKIYDEKVNKSYQAVFIENKYIKIMILPELGGRIQMAFDKVKQRHFVYYNQVIKPALVGLTGPWISGGIEFNWPQHHRPSTFDPVDYTITSNLDGSKTVWVNEVERMFRTRGTAGFTLYPGKAFLEVKGKLYNRTPFPQTFLWWANPAVKVNDHYQSVFPPDVHAVYDHGKRDVSAFPIAKGVYYKVNYAPGTDISRYKNIPVPTSFMAVSSNYDFIGGYEHDSKGGLLHVADHHIAPGKKQWTWGNGDFGRTWDKNLTDEDGPYIELMTGVYTDNQPDFSWLQPYEEKTFVQYFLPYSEVGMVKNATKDAVINLEFDGAYAEIKLYTTSACKRIAVTLFLKNQQIFSEEISTSPHAPYHTRVLTGNGVLPEDLMLQITDMATGKKIVHYRPEKPTEQPIPEPAKAAMKPEDVENNEQLYLTGLHLEQYRHATYSPDDYYREALRRDPGDVRNNNAMGLWLMKRGQFRAAELCFQTAIDTMTRRNPNPYDGEPYFNLGWSLKMQNKTDAAYNAFYKSVWNDAWQHAGYLNLAQIAVKRFDYEQALVFIDQSLVKNQNSHSARHARAYILRKLHRYDQAETYIDESLGVDPFNFGCLFEKFLLLAAEDTQKEAAQSVLNHLKTITRTSANNFIELAIDYAHAGLFQEAQKLLLIYKESGIPNTMTEYYLGWLSSQSGDHQQASVYFKQASALPTDYVFPNKTDDIPVLQCAIEINPNDSNAWYYLGNLWYDKRQYNEAIACWEQSIRLNGLFAAALRNLSIALYNKRHESTRALLLLEQAFSLNTTDARLLMELDQLYKLLNKEPVVRLDLLERYVQLTEQRDDLYLERIILNNQLGRFGNAKLLLQQHQFHPWEGGEGKVIHQYILCHLGLAKKAISAGDYEEAIQLLDQAENYPSNLGEGKLPGTPENDIHYWKGIVYEKMNNPSLSVQYFEKATVGVSEPSPALYYNDPQPDKIFYQGLAWKKLNEEEKAKNVFRRLMDFGHAHLNDNAGPDYFAVSLPGLSVFDRDMNLLNKIHCYYLIALGHLGLEKPKSDQSAFYFEKIFRLDRNHQGALVHSQKISFQ